MTQAESPVDGNPTSQESPASLENKAPPPPTFDPTQVKAVLSSMHAGIEKLLTTLEEKGEQAFDSIGDFASDFDSQVMQCLEH